MAIHLRAGSDILSTRCGARLGIGGLTTTVPKHVTCPACRRDLPETVYHLWTDGACQRNPGGPGGWGFVLLDEEGTVIVALNGRLEMTTSNRAELEAILQGLRAAQGVERDGLMGHPQVVLHTDSEYCAKVLKDLGAAEVNRDLVRAVHRAAEPFAVEVNVVRGHRGLEHNERAHELATIAMRG